MGARATVALLLALAGMAEGAPRKLTLAELDKLARERNKEVGHARAGLVFRRALKSEALANWAPIGQVTYAITGVPAIQCRGPGDDANPATRQRDCVNTVDPNTGQSVSVLGSGIRGVGMQGTLELIQPIYTFGKIESATQAAGHAIEAGRHELDAALQQSDFDAARAYWGLKAARAAVAALDAVREELEPWIDRIDKDINTAKPQFTVMDLQRLKTGLDELDVGRAAAGKGVAVALAGLHALTGEEVDVDDGELDPVELTDRSLDHYLAESLAHRPELRAVASGVEVFRGLARMRMAEMLPDVGLNLSVLMRFSSSIEDADNAFVEQGTVTRLGLFLGIRQTIEFPQRFTRWKRVQAEAGIMEARAELARTGVDFQVRLAYGELDEARKRLAATDHGQKTARGWLSAAKQNLDLGTAEPRDLADAVKQYVGLRILYFQAIHDVNIAMAHLQRATGVR